MFVCVQYTWRVTWWLTRNAGLHVLHAATAQQERQTLSRTFWHNMAVTGSHIVAATHASIQPGTRPTFGNTSDSSARTASKLAAAAATVRHTVLPSTPPSRLEICCQSRKMKLKLGVAILCLEFPVPEFPVPWAQLPPVGRIVLALQRTAFILLHHIQQPFKCAHGDRKNLSFLFFH